MSHKGYNKEEYWKTKEGTLIKLSDMEDSHLANSLAMILKRENVLKATLKLVKETADKLAYEKVKRVGAKEKAQKDAALAAQVAAQEAHKVKLTKLSEPRPGRKFRIA